MKGRLLGVDYGTVRVGLAVSDPDRILASPLATYTRRDTAADAAYDWLIAQGHRPERIVIQGESLGSAVAVDLAARKRCAGVILELPFNSASAR